VGRVVNARASDTRRTLVELPKFLAANAPAEWDGGDLGYMVGGLCSMADDALVEYDAMLARLERAETALRRIEWCWERTGDDESEGVNRCPACGMTDTQGHDHSCDLDAALAGVAAERTPE
jgi:hypothetical protein